METSASSTSSSSSNMMPTNTLLAVPDGPVASGSSDLKNHAVSYIGGYPVSSLYILRRENQKHSVVSSILSS